MIIKIKENFQAEIENDNSKEEEEENKLMLKTIEMIPLEVKMRSENLMQAEKNLKFWIRKLIKMKIEIY
jgi:AAA+ superfamily predicted ATPase